MDPLPLWTIGRQGLPVSHREVSLVFFSTFEPISLILAHLSQPHSSQTVACRGTVFQAASLLSTLFVCPVENVLGLFPLLLCYLNMKGNEVNIWMWRYGRAFPRKISVKDAAEMWRQRVQDSKHWDVLALKCSRLAEGSWLNKTEGTIVNDIVYNIVYYIVHIRYRVHIPFMILQVHIVCDTVCFPVIIGSLQTGGRERGLTGFACPIHSQFLALFSFLCTALCRRMCHSNTCNTAFQSHPDQ